MSDDHTRIKALERELKTARRHRDDAIRLNNEHANEVARMTGELARSGAEVERLKARIQASDRHGAEGWKMAQTLGEGFQRKAFWSAGRKRALRRGSISAANLSVLRTEHAKRVASDAEVERLRGLGNEIAKLAALFHHKRLDAASPAQTTGGKP